MKPNILIIAQTRDGNLTKATLQTIGLGLQLAGRSGGTCTVAALGSDADAAAQEAAALGPTKVLRIRADSLDAYSPDAWARAIAGLVDGECGLVLGAASARTRDVMPRVAARLGLPMFSECTAVEWTDDGIVVERALYGGKIIARVRPTTDRALAILRPNVVEAAQPSEGAAAPVEDVQIDPGEPRAVVAEFEDRSGGRPQITDAEIIVSAGRGLQNPDNLKLVSDLASVLGAAVGASRAIVDADWIDHSHQVGQTGATVAPALYVACGISGAIQHVAGMSNAGTIVAINRDPDAPIFKIADYGLVGDAMEILPVLTEKAKAFLG